MAEDNGNDRSAFKRSADSKFYREELDAILAALPTGPSEEEADDTGDETPPRRKTPAALDTGAQSEPEKKRFSLLRKEARPHARRAEEDDEDDEEEDEEESRREKAARKALKKEARKRAKEEKRRKAAQKRMQAASDSMKNSHPRLRLFVIVLITLVLIMLLLLVGVSKVLSSPPAILNVPAEGISAVMQPVQSVFTSVTETFADFFRTIKLYQNIEDEYNSLREEYEQIVYDAARARELEIQLSQFENIYDEIAANANMQPLVARVIGRDDGNYFSTFTINVGSADGVEQYMAVTISGALVGYTETVQDKSATVRTIIDSEASIAALIQSSRDQGTVRGTLGIDGEPMCRMYYLPDDHLPRPGDIVVTSGVGMSFPKGIPIGTVRESTRGMQANKQYIVVEPSADFQHLEYVIVLRYQPTPLAVQGRGGGSDAFEELATARPYPTLRFGSMNYFGVTASPEPEEGEETPSPDAEETPAPEETAATATPPARPTPTPAATGEEFEYHPVGGDPTPTPSPSPTPSPTPFETLDPSAMTFEDED